MSRQAVIKIKCEIHIPFDRKTFGDTGRAETAAVALQQELQKRLDTELVKWSAEHSSIEVTDAPETKAITTAAAAE